MSAGVSLLTIPIIIHSKYLPINQFLLMDQSSNTQLKTLSMLLLALNVCSVQEYIRDIENTWFQSILV